MEMKKYLRNNMNLFDKVEWVKQLCADAIGVSEDEVIRKMLGRLRKRGVVQKRKYGLGRFTQQELILDQLLKSNEVSPRTAYRWFCMLKAPKEILEIGKENELSQNEILRRSQGVLQKVTPEQQELGEEIRQEILKLVRLM